MISAKARTAFIAATPMVFVVLWATGFVVARLSAGHVAPLWFLSLRFPLALVFMLVVALLQKARWPNATQALHAMVAGAFLHGFYLATNYWAVAHGLPGGVAALIIGLQPLITAFMASLILGERVSLRHWLGLGVGLVGIALVLSPKLQFSHTGGITPVTAGVTFLGAVAIAFGTVYQKRFATGIDLATGGVYQYVGATLVVLLLAVFTEDFFFDHSLQAWAALAWSVIVLSIIAISLLMVMIREGAVSRVSSLIFLVPGVAALMTYVLFGEELNWIQILGMVVCAGAVLTVTRKPAT